MNEQAIGQKTADALEQLSAATPDGRARIAALRATVGRGARSSSDVVSYCSAGSVLVIGPEDEALQAAHGLTGGLRRTVLVTGGKPELRRETGSLRTIDGVIVVDAGLRALTGHLGEFNARVMIPEGEADLAPLTGAGRERFDLVLDLNSPAFIRREILPPGYYAPGTDPEALRRALSEIPQLVGEFEKPKYFHYDPGICAHGASGLKGCTRCLEVCPTFAITSVGDKIAVDPHLCQGAGSCATACPTGAIAYAYPPVRDLLDTVRALLKTYREGGGRKPWLLFHDEGGRRLLASVAARIPEQIIPLQIEETGSVGMDTWLAGLAYGASRVLLLATSATAPSEIRELRKQMEYATAILAGMDYAPERLQLIGADDAAELLEKLDDPAPEPEIAPASFAAMPEKRTTIRLAVDHLYARTPHARRAVPLPAGAPYGEIRVNREACTLCMACVGVCPASALSDGADLPQLIFHESNCVQCGLCEAACPEQAITRAPRFLYDPALRRQARILNEEQPFCCIVCGKPFATRAIMERMAERLKDHWMFQAPGALRRLQMCEDCRVQEMLRSTGGLVDAHRKP